MRSVVSIARVPVALEAEDSKRWSAMMAVFSHCDPTHQEPELTVRFRAVLPDTPEEEPDHAVNGLDLWFSRGVVAFRHESGVAALTEGATIEVGGGTDGQDVERGFRLVVQYALIEEFARLGNHALHAAVLERDGAGILVIGGMGSGKSTLCYAAARAGWNVLSDDIAWIVGKDPLLVAGLPKPLKVPRDTVLRPPAGAFALAEDARRRWVMPAEFVRSEGTPALRGVLFVDHAEGDGVIEFVPSGPSLIAQIMRIFPLAHMQVHNRSFFPMAVRIGQLPALALLHDADAVRRVDVAARLLDQAAAAFRGGLAASVVAESS